jgi:hypothetical protein
MNNKQHREDTKYLQWADGMYVMLEDLLCDYEKALIEDSLRRSVYFDADFYFEVYGWEDCLGVNDARSGIWGRDDKEYMFIKITRAQALYIATGDTDI